MNESSQAIYINESGIVVLEIEKDKRIPMMIDTLLDIWKSSVRASHHFLTEDDIIRLTPQAEDALRGIENPMGDGRPAASGRFYGYSKP